jgi:PKD repeat protein
MLGDNPLEIASTTTEYIDPGVTSLDDLGVTFVVTNNSADIMTTLNMTTPGNYTVTYTASNAGVSTSTTRTVIVK